MSSPHTDAIEPLVKMRGWQTLLGVVAGLFTLLFALVGVFLLLGLIFSPGGARMWLGLALVVYGPLALMYGWIAVRLLGTAGALGKVSILGDEAVETALERLLGFWRAAAVLASVVVLTSVAWMVFTMLYADELAAWLAAVARELGTL